MALRQKQVRSNKHLWNWTWNWCRSESLHRIPDSLFSDYDCSTRTLRTFKAYVLHRLSYKRNGQTNCEYWTSNLMHLCIPSHCAFNYIRKRSFQLSFPQTQLWFLQVHLIHATSKIANISRRHLCISAVAAQIYSGSTLLQIHDIECTAGWLQTTANVLY